MSRLNNAATAVTGFFCRFFYRWGHVVGRFPVPFILVPLVTFAALGVFFAHAQHETDVEDMYTPIDSRARAERTRVKAMFKDGSGDNFNPMSINDHPLGAAIIVQQHDKTNIVTDQAYEAMNDLIHQIKNVSMVLNLSVIVPKESDADLDSLGLNMTSEGLVTSGNYVTLEDYESVHGKGELSLDVKVVTISRLVRWKDICARLKGECQIEGVFIFSDEFKTAWRKGNVTYPYWDSPWGTLDLSRTLGNATVSQSGYVTSVRAVRFIFNLRRDTEHYKFLSLEWEKHFLEVLPEKLESTPLDVAYATSHSLGLEMDKGTNGDLWFFILTFALMNIYTSFVTAGGDCVSSRSMLSRAGVLTAVLGISGSLGLVSLVGVPFVNIVACMPFLVLGIGVDDMFLMTSAWSGTLGNRDLTVPERLGSTFRTAGIGITITSLTDGLAFAVGGFTSVFQCVRYFCIYTGTAVVICYLCNLTFFGGCMALHGRRVYSGRHSLTCRKVKTNKELQEEGRNWCFRRFCGGSVPGEVGADESMCEKAPRLFLPRLVLWAPAKIVILVAFAGFLGVSIWGTIRLQQGLVLKSLVLPSSFYYKFNTWDEEIFGVTFPISFVIDEPLDYTNRTTAMAVWDLLSKVREDPDISDWGPHCWLLQYFLSPHFVSTSKEDFLRNLQHKFLPENPHYINDVIIEDDVIVASRCHVFTRSVTESPRQADLMLRMRQVADEASFSVFAYQPIFVFFEQYAAIVPNTLYTVGVTLAAMFLVSFVLLVHPLMVVLVLFNVIMIVVGIFGFMALWGLTLSSVTMIHLIMSVGFSVDFSAHVCAAYMTSTERTRQERARHALVHASGPILNGGISSFIGVVALIFSDSYIFRSFFMIMFLVIAFGVLHAVFLMPVILSLIGPELRSEEKSACEIGLQSNGVSRDMSHANGKDCGSGSSLKTIAYSTYYKTESTSLSEWLGGVPVLENQDIGLHL